MKVSRKKISLVVYFLSLILTIVLIVFGSIKKYDKPMTTNNKDQETKIIGIINRDSTISNPFVVGLNSIDNISVIYANFSSETIEGNMLIEIYDNNSELIYLNKYDLSELNDNSKLNFDFDEKKNVLGEIFELRITIENLNENESITFYGGKEDDYSVVQLEDTIENNELDLNGSIFISQIGIGKSYYYVFVLFVILIIEAIIGGYKYLKINLKSKRLLIGCICSIIISIIMACSLVFLSYKVNYSNKMPIFITLTLLITSFIEFSLIGSSIANRKGNLSKLFLALAIPLGALYLICVIPGNVPDENFHSIMTYELATGQISMKDVKTPEEFEKANYKYRSYKKVMKGLKDNHYTLVSRDNGGYNLFMYITGAIGMSIGLLFKAPIIVCYTLGSLVNYLVFLLVGYLVIEKLPFAKYAALVYMLSPMYLQQATSLSCDALINASVMLFLSYILHLKYKKEEMTTKEIVIISCLSAYLTICKFAYFPLLLLLFLIKDKLKQHFKKSKKTVIICATCCFLFGLGVYSYMKIYLPSTITPTNNIVEIEKPQPEITKMEYTFSDFSKVPYLIINTFDYNMNFYFMSFAGQSLGALEINTPHYLCIIFYVIVIISVFFDSDKKELSKKEKKLLFFIWFIDMILIFGGLYLGWGDLKALLVQGVQGRYFIPINILLLLIINSKKIKFDIKNKNELISIPLIFINILSIIKIITFFNII